MPVIELSTRIKAPVGICFDLARSIDLHSYSTRSTKEKAIAGRTSGLIDLHETVTWRATHLGVQQTLCSRITAMHRPFSFVDKQVKGIFKSLHHTHLFEAAEDHVVMKDIFRFEAPCGWAGRLFNKLFLTAYLTRFLQERNEIIRQTAENNEWRKWLPDPHSPEYNT